MQYTFAIIEHEVEESLIHQRAADGYVNGTAICKATGKQMGHYLSAGPTREFLRELSSDIDIPISDLVIVIKGGQPELQGTWVHPKVAIHLGTWCSAKFAVLVSNWVYEWMTGNVKGRLPYHIQRYMANRAAIPPTHFSMLNELIFGLVAPLEDQGYTLPDNMVPDISTGQMFSSWLRKHGFDTKAMPTYIHRYADGREVPARLYPNSVLADFRNFFHGTWLQNRATGYFAERDPSALPYLPRVLQHDARPAMEANRDEEDD